MLGLTAGIIHKHKQPKTVSTSSQIVAQSLTTQTTPATSTTTSSKPLTDPLPNALSRITKKNFGIYITPATSPVQPERFIGYHTGDDLETTAAEQAGTVPVVAACGGKLLVKEYASGYGGVAVESCTIHGEAVTIIYGHLYIDSITPTVGDTLTAGEHFANLGQGYTTQTDGEREHLHFGIHIGTTVNILGYVQKESDLSGWLDPATYLQ
jgi:murein DD-endopeptidase MepM/ murein hydrolase activator NlpD